MHERLATARSDVQLVEHEKRPSSLFGMSLVVELDFGKVGEKPRRRRVLGHAAALVDALCDASQAASARAARLVSGRQAGCA